MGRQRTAYGRNSYRSRSYGSERAKQHIREAEQLSKELGGTDKDVKSYFFSLPYGQLQTVLSQYEAIHGPQAREYAENTMHKWRSGQVHMSGMVAERLFKLLPPIMPLHAKYQLTESLWKHVGPSSKKVFYVGLDADLAEVERTVTSHLETVVTRYEIPASMEARFDWLAQRDVSVKQQLLNHLQQQERALLADALRVQLPVLMDHLRSGGGALTTHAANVLNVGKHEVRIVFSDKVAGITESAPIIPGSGSDNSWVWWVVGVALLMIILANN